MEELTRIGELNQSGKGAQKCVSDVLKDQIISRNLVTKKEEGKKHS